MGLYPDEWLNLSVEPVRHQFKLPVRGDEGDGAVVLKPRETHTLVELDVLQLHRFTACPCEGERVLSTVPGESEMCAAGGWG